METTSPAMSVALAVLAVLLGPTGFGIYTAFGPPSKQLSDPFDDHDDGRRARSSSNCQGLSCSAESSQGP